MRAGKLLKKGHLLRCALAPLCGVHPIVRLRGRSRAPRICLLFEQPAWRGVFRLRAGPVRPSTSSGRTVFLFAAWLITLTGCATLYNPATGRQETVLDTSIEVALGNIARSEMGLVSLQVGRVPSGDLRRVQGIGQELAAVSDRQDLRYQFGVIQDDEFNAFTLPGGTIYVHSGLAEKVSDEELAAVLGHEIGHVAARHVAKSLQAQLGYALLMQVAAGAGMGPDSARMANTVYGILRNGFSREDEREADRLGIEYLHRAGYDPQAMVRMLERMLGLHPEGPLSRAFAWQRTHPLASERIANARAEIARLKTQAFCPACGREYAAGERFCPKDGAFLKLRSF